MRLPHGPRSSSGSLCLDGWVRPRLRGFAPVPALLVGTGDERAVALRVLLEQVRLPALRARPWNRPVPRRELAVRVVHAAEEALSEARFALGEAAAAVGADHALQRDRPGRLAGGIVRAREESAEPTALVHHRLAARGAGLLGGQILDHPDRAVFLDEVLGVLAVRVPGAGQKAPHAAPLDHHRAAALLAHQVGGLLLALHVAHLRFRRREALLEGLVEFAQHRLPIDLAFLDLVELLLHPRSELHVHHAREGAEQKLGDYLAQIGGEEPALLLLHVLLVLDGREDGGVRRRPADAFLLQLLDQRRFGEPRRGLGEVLLGDQVDELERLPRLQRRKLAGDVALLLVLTLHLLGARFLLRLLRFLPVHREVSGELQDLPGGPERGPARLDVRGGLIEHRRHHLAGDEAVPDQLVEPEHVLFEERLHALRRMVERGRPDRLVRVLRALLRLELDRLGGQVLLPPAPCDVLARARDRIGREPDGVGAHVGDQRRLPVVSELHAFVEPLREGHGLLGGEAQPVGGFLLQLRRNEGRRRVATTLLLRHLDDDELLAPQLLDQRPRDLAGGNLRLLAVEPDQLGAELRRERRAQVCLDAPVLDGNELRDLFFPLDHQPHRDALDPSRRESTANLLPEDGRDLVPDQPIQDAPRLLRVVEVAVELQRLLDRFLDGFLGDLVEEDALRGDLGPLQLLVDVPGDGLALPVGVRREQDQLRALGGGLELRDYLLLRVDHLVDGLETVLDVDADLALRQVHHVAHRGLHHVPGTQVLLDGLGLRRRLDDDQGAALPAGGHLAFPTRLSAGLSGFRRLRCYLAGCHVSLGAAIDAGTPNWVRKLSGAGNISRASARRCPSTPAPPAYPALPGRGSARGGRGRLHEQGSSRPEVSRVSHRSHR